ncbi:MAG: hypothetical protein WB615_11005 [Candidatus Tumulicola sp.]
MRRHFANARIQLLTALAAGGISIATACSQTTSGAGTGFTPASAVSPARLPNGAGATIVTSALRGGVRVAVAYDPRGLVAAPNDAWEIVPGTLRASFSPAVRVSENASGAGVRLTLPYPQARSVDILLARAPIVSANYANGTTLRWPQPGAFDETRRLVTVDVPSGLLAGATSVVVALGVDSRRIREEPPGPRYWDGKNWSRTGTIQSGKKTVVLIHGIFSTVESAFPTGYIFKCPNDIAKAQGFDQVLGFDYDWFEPPQKEGALFAEFLKKVVAANVSSLTIEAHSYGSLVSVAAIPKLGPDAKIANLVTLGGPLPLRGTPLAEKKNHWRMGMMLGLLDWYLNYPPDVVDKAFDSGMVASLATNSDALKEILSDYKAMQNKPHAVQAAGTEWICFIPGIRSCNYSEETFKDILVNGTGVTLPWDGVVEKDAALSVDFPDAAKASFPLSHVELECKNSVIKWVASQLQ